VLTNPDELLPIALEAVDLAVKVLHDAHGYGPLKSKGDRDYASQLDLDVEHRLRNHLAVATPDIGFFGEEEGTRGDPDGPRWVLDPIDGTVNFVHGLPLYAVSLALVVGQQPVLGVIDLPATGTRYHAVQGHGARRNDQPMAAVEPPSSLSSAIVAIGDYAVGDRAEEKNRVRLAVTSRLAAKALRIRMLGTAATDLAWLAEGHLDATITLSNNPWDMSAGVVIARETGHRVVDAEGHDYSIDSPATIAAHQHLLPEVLALLEASVGLGHPKTASVRRGA
jgi:myo-inositol-1(or 4)-monophosphatase